MTRKRSTDTPRTDNFIETMPAIVFDPADFADHNALVRATVQVREHMLAWAQFMRQLEREIMQSTPNEWKE